MLKYVNYPSLITRPFHFSSASRFIDHSDRCSGLSISGRSFSDHNNCQSWYSIAFWTIATIILNQQSIISTMAIDNLNHQSINSTIAIDFLIISRELIPLLTDMVSHKQHSIHVCALNEGASCVHFLRWPKRVTHAN